MSNTYHPALRGLKQAKRERVHGLRRVLVEQATLLALNLLSVDDMLIRSYWCPVSGVRDRFIVGYLLSLCLFVPSDFVALVGRLEMNADCPSTIYHSVMAHHKARLLELDTTPTIVQSRISVRSLQTCRAHFTYTSAMWWYTPPPVGASVILSIH